MQTARYSAYRTVQLDLYYGRTTQMTLTVLVLNWLNLASRRKMHKCNLVFKCLNKVVSKYLTQYFTRNAELHDYATS